MKRSGQVKPSNAMSARRRTVLEPPSLPIRYLPRSVSVSPAALVTVASTWSAVCASPVSLVENRTSPSPLAFEQADVEPRNQLAGGAVAEMEQRRFHAAGRLRGEHLLLEPERHQHIH